MPGPVCAPPHAFRFAAGTRTEGQTQRLCTLELFLLRRREAREELARHIYFHTTLRCDITWMLLDYVDDERHLRSRAPAVLGA